MNDLFSKLNTLARARLNDALNNLPSLPRFERAPDLQRQVTELRQRINDALDHEDQLEAQVNGLREEVARLDNQADDAVAQGRDADARYILEQLKRTEQRLGIAESDLKMHQRDAAELILKVNQLEAAVADHQASVTGMGDSTASTTDIRSTTASAATSESPTSRLSSPTPPAGSTTSTASTITSGATAMPVTPAASTTSTNASATTPTPAAPTSTETAPVQPTRTQIPIEASPPSDVMPQPIVAVPAGIDSSIDTSFEANSDDLPDFEPATDAGASAAPAPTAKPEADEEPDEDQPETAKSYARRAREEAQQQADKTSTAASQISDLIQDAQERTRARIQSLTDILEAKDREQAASPLYQREQPTPPSTSSTTLTPTAAPETKPTENPSATAPSTQPVETNNADESKPDEPKNDDILSERLKRLSKPE